MHQRHARGAHPSRSGAGATPPDILHRTIAPPAVTGRAIAQHATAILSVVARLYLAFIWFRFGWGKIQTGWLASNPLRPLVELVANGSTHPWPGAYEWLARATLELGVDRLLAPVFPIMELTIAIALAAGVLVRPAALLATFVNINLILAGLATWQFDGRFIVLQLALLAAGPSASRYGLAALRRWRRRSAGEVPGTKRPHVVIIGGGFGGLQAARALRGAPVDVTVVDRTNHHLFQPLLYQVAMAVLSPNHIAVPIRSVLRRQRNATVLLAEVTGIRTGERVVELQGGRRLSYDFLIVAAGARHSYFGRTEWEARAPGLKNLDDALEIRRRFLLAFERAELHDTAQHAMDQTIVIVGGGPTGVELAGAIPEVANKTLVGEFRRADTRRTRVLLIERGQRLLPSFDPRLSARARAHLEALGVEVRTDTAVTRITDSAVHVGDEVIPTRAVLWAAGNAASPLGRLLGAPLDRAGRVRVMPDLSVPGHPEVFVVGDLAAALTNGGATVPAVATAAMQMGRAAAGNVLATVAGRPRAPFRYVNKGSVAVIGRRMAVAQIGRLRFAGRLACALWAFVHLYFLIGFRSRTKVFVEWVHALVTYGRGDRVITGTPEPRVLDTSVRALHRPAETTTSHAAIGVVGLDDGR